MRLPVCIAVAHHARRHDAVRGSPHDQCRDAVVDPQHGSLRMAEHRRRHGVPCVGEHRADTGVPVGSGVEQQRDGAPGRVPAERDAVQVEHAGERSRSVLRRQRVEQRPEGGRARSAAERPGSQRRQVEPRREADVARADLTDVAEREHRHAVARQAIGEPAVTLGSDVDAVEDGRDRPRRERGVRWKSAGLTLRRRRRVDGRMEQPVVDAVQR